MTEQQSSEAPLITQVEASWPRPFNIAAGIHEDALNSFADAHHRHNFDETRPSLYRGEAKAEELGISKWTYSISKPGEFDLAPIDAATVRAARNRWLMSIPEIYNLSQDERRWLKQSLEVEPNITLRLPKIDFVIEFDPEVTSPPPPTISVAFGAIAIGRVSLSANNEFIFSPLSISVEDPRALDEAIRAELERLGIQPGEAAAENVGTICYPIESLLKHLLQAFLNTRIEKFTRILPLPSVVRLFEGVEITNLGLLVIDDYMVAIGDAVPSQRDLMFGAKSQQNLAELHGANVCVTQSDKSFSFSAKEADRSLSKFDENDAIEEDRAQEDGHDLPSDGTNVFLYLSKGLLSLFADMNLNIDEEDRDQSKDGDIETKWSWWYRLRHTGLEFRDRNKVRVRLEFAGGGSAGARLHTHCGPLPWLETDLAAKLIPSPTILDLRARLVGREIKFHADTRPSAVIVTPERWWDALGWVLSWIITVVGTAIWNLIDFALNFMLFKVATLPEKFPGTGLGYNVSDFRTYFVDGEFYTIAMKVDF